ncbi:MAG: DUF2812 domain-containing protein [Clostridia bacterium]|nr:DUF2812 domain-containing protein [Clostridia bacterium]
MPQFAKMIKYKFFPSHKYDKLDAWLNDMSKNGWRLINYGFLKYEFQRSNNAERTYFTYNLGGFRNDDGYYSIGLRYPRLKEQYGLAPRYSFLNKNIRDKFFSKIIIELDAKKIDKGFSYIVDERNRLYRKQFLMNFIYISIAVIGFAIITII